LAPDLWSGRTSLSAGVCAFADAVVRLAQMQADSLMIFTTTCDQMRRGFDALAATGRTHAFLFNIPATWQTPAARAIYRSELERLGRFFQTMGGHAPSPQTLKREMIKYGEGRERLLEAARGCSPRQFAEAVARFHWDGSINLPSSPKTPPEHGIPLAVVGGPLSAPQWNLLDIIEAAGGQVALNASETGERSLWPAFAFEDQAETPDSLLSRGCFENIVDVFQRPNTRLYSWLKERLASRAVRGIVLWVYTGCDLWRAEAQTLRETFGLPVLLLEADEAQNCGPRDAGRIEAFVETLQ
jgi:benzoyl-CoA reductase/2-hydroxyglutaryl-CoA dehydratase subunit BcrC/BadD/HgdB